ncbi:hypothetical protein SESBI_37918 [Sesbania bispinosa]|nr:hypothetical protein SESBI_37918 [Sesbania bispinosa]
MARTRQTGSWVPPRGASSSQPPAEDSEASGRYSWVESTFRDANSFVSKDDATAYIASLPSTPCFELIHPTMDERVSDRPWTSARDDWFYMYDYCLMTLGVQMSFSDFQV